jgi:hypothetical protein
VIRRNKEAEIRVLYSYLDTKMHVCYSTISPICSSRYNMCMDVADLPLWPHPTCRTYFGEDAMSSACADADVQCTDEDGDVSSFHGSNTEYCSCHSVPFFIPCSLSSAFLRCLARMQFAAFTECASDISPMDRR